MYLCTFVLVTLTYFIFGNIECVIVMRVLKNGLYRNNVMKILIQIYSVFSFRLQSTGTLHLPKSLIQTQHKHWLREKFLNIHNLDLHTKHVTPHVTGTMIN